MPPDPKTGSTRGKSILGTSSASAQTAAHVAKEIKSSSGNRGSTTNRSRANQPGYGWPLVGELVNPSKDELNTGGERGSSPTKSSRKSRSRNVDSSASLGITAGRIVRSEDQDPVALSRRLPGLPNSQSSTLNSLPPAEGVKSQGKDVADAESVDPYGDSSGVYGEDEDIYEDARAISQKLATPGFKEVLTQKEYEAFRHHAFQKEQQ